MDPRQHPRDGVKTLEKLNDLHATIQILHTNVGYFTGNNIIAMNIRSYTSNQ